MPRRTCRAAGFARRGVLAWRERRGEFPRQRWGLWLRLGRLRRRLMRQLRLQPQLDVSKLCDFYDSLGGAERPALFSEPIQTKMKKRSMEESICREMT